MTYLSQSQVPDGMVANVPWGTPVERWSDRMIERGLKHLSDTDGENFFTNLWDLLMAEARERGLDLDAALS